MGKFVTGATDHEIVYSNFNIECADLSGQDKPTAFFKFDSLPLVDYISQNVLNINNTSQDQVFLSKGAFGNALRLRPLTILSFGLPSVTDPIDQFSVGFWLNPVHVKPTSNPSTGLPNYYRMSLLDKANFSLDGASGIVNMVGDESTFVIYEECRDNKKNTMRVALQSDAGEESTFVTPEYSTDQLHYFWITYSGQAGDFRIFIDGIDQDLTMEEGPGIPSSLNTDPSVPLRINNSALGFNGLLRGNYGLIDELLYRAEYETDPNILAKHINLGSEYALNDAVSHLEEVFQGFAFDDPTTIDVSSVFSNGKNIYAGRSDGKLFRGDRTMWKARRDFANRDEINFVEKNVLASDSIVDIEDGSLKLFKATARI